MTPSTSFDVRRPVVRSYLPTYLANAVKHVRAGGHAVIRATTSWYLLLPCDDDGDMPELAAWALLDLQLTKSTRVRFAMELVRHDSAASLAAFTAASTSAGVEYTTLRCTSPVAGLKTSPVRSPVEADGALLIQ